MKLFGALTFSLIPSLAIASSSGYGLSLTLQSPFIQETDAGTVVTATFFLVNELDEDHTYLIDLDLPEGWISIPFEEPYVELKAHESKVIWIAIRVPKNALAGTYPISCSVYSREKPSIRSVSEFSVLVLGQEGIEASIEQAPKYKVAGEPYEVVFIIENTGNTEVDIDLEYTDSSNLNLSETAPKQLRLPAGHTESVSLKVSTDKNTKYLMQHFINISLQIRNKSGTRKYLYTIVDIYPKSTEKVDKYARLPMKTVLGYGMKNSQKQLYLEQYLSGTIDEKKQKHIDGFARLPFINQENVDRNLGGVPESAYLHYWTPFVDLYGGEGVYELSPLVMLNRFGQGCSLTLNPGPVSLKGVYLQDTSSLSQTVAGGSLTYRPIKDLSLSANVLQNYLSENTQLILNAPEQEMSQSILAKYKSDRYGSHTAEYGKTAPILGAPNNSSSFYLYSKASPYKNTWYALQMIYSQPGFIGYYENTGQIYASVGFPIYKKLQASVSYNTIAYNVENNPLDGNSPRLVNIYGGLSYTFPFGLYASAYYSVQQTKYKDNKYGYRTSYGTLNGGQTFKRWTFQGIIEYGHYQDFEPQNRDRTWQSYQFYSYYQPTARQQYAAYTRIGFIQLSQNAKWTHIYGGSAVWTATDSLKLQALYEYTGQSSKRNYFSGRAQYTFNNRHTFEIHGYVNNQTQVENVTQFLASYSIPWGLPIRRKKSKTNIYGKIVTNENGVQKPYPNLIVHCSGQRTITDKKGNFEFPDLIEGNYHIWTEDKPNHWVAAEGMPRPIEVKSGQTKQANICFEHPASLEGSLLVYEFDGENLKQEGALKNTSIVLESTATKERLYTKTSQKGTFTFDHISPGRWVVQVADIHIPDYHYLEEAELLVDLFPGEEKSVSLKVLPIKRNLRMIDIDTIHSN